MLVWMHNPYFYIALIALIIKIFIVNDLQKHWRPNLNIFLLFVAISCIHTIFEISGYLFLDPNNNRAIQAVMNGYYILLIAMVILLPFATASILEQNINSYLLAGAALLLAAFSFTLINTNLIVSGYKPLGFAFTKIAGPYYWIYPAAILTVLTYNTAYLISTHKNAPEIAKAKTANMLVGFASIFIFGVIITFGMALGFSIKAAGIVPATFTLYLLFMALNIRDDKVFDIRTKLPWTEQYKTIQLISKPYVYKTHTPVSASIMKQTYFDQLIVLASSTFDSAEKQAEWLGCSVSTLNRHKSRLGLHKKPQKKG